MKFGRFTGFSKNAPFGKPGILPGFQGPGPPFGMTLVTPGKDVSPGIIWGLQGKNRQAGTGFSGSSAGPGQKNLKKIFCRI
jgi:hypothetical protein